MTSRVSLMLLVALVICSLLPLVAARTHVHSHGQHRQPAVDPAEAATIRAMQQWRSLKVAEEKLLEQQLSAPLAWTYGFNNYTLQRPEGARTFFLYVPKSYSSAKPVSLVQSLHGLGDDAHNFAVRTNLSQQAEEWGFIGSFPQGSTGLIGTGWNAGTCCVDQSVDDVGFLSAVLASVLQTFAIRNDSIHSMGFSNGAFMSERLGCQLASVFTSVASVSGNTILLPGNAAGLAACDALYASPASILHIHGNADLVVPWTGDELLGFPSVPDDIAAWVKRNRCAGPPVQTLNFDTFTNQIWSNCADGNSSVEIVLNDGGGHSYPMDPAGFDSTNYLLAFWNRVTPGGL